MITAIREVRTAKGMTLSDVAARCKPATTAQTIGRLETGTRTVSIGWLNRIALALGVDAADLVRLPDQNDIPVVAILDHAGAKAPPTAHSVTAPRADGDTICMTVETSVGDYRAGDQVWCEKVSGSQYATMLNRDILLPRLNGRFVFGRLIGQNGTRFQVLPPSAGSKQQIIVDPSWAAVAVRLTREI